MSTAPISSASISPDLQTYLQARKTDLQQLGQALQSGDLAGAQQAYNAIQTLAQSGPFANSNAFKVSQRQQDFAAIGQALQSGDLAGAQQAFAQLGSTFQRSTGVVSPQTSPAVIVNISDVATAAPPTATSTSTPPPTVENTTPSPSSATTATGSGPEIILNLGNSSGPEQITIGFNNSSSGEQVTIAVSNQQNQNPEQITLNLGQNTNQQIVLNLLNSSATASTGGSVNVSA